MSIDGAEVIAEKLEGCSPRTIVTGITPFHIRSHRNHAQDHEGAEAADPSIDHRLRVDERRTDECNRALPPQS
jgi:hypothetical protein